MSQAETTAGPEQAVAATRLRPTVEEEPDRFHGCRMFLFTDPNIEREYGRTKKISDRWLLRKMRALQDSDIDFGPDLQPFIDAIRDVGR